MLEPAGKTALSREIQSLKEKISRLEVRKSALTLELDNLDSELTLLHSRQANLESRMAPIWMLPNEVLSYIFELGAFSQDSKTRNKSSNHVPGKLDFPTLVSHVSRHFRDVAIKTPTLWSVINVLDFDEPRLNHIKRCLERSCSLPYSIRIFVREDDYTYVSKSIMGQAMTLVKANMYRLERFEAGYPFFNLLHEIMKYLDEPAPRLATLELSVTDCEDYFDEEALFELQSLRDPLTLFDGQMPKLTKVRLDGVHVAWPQCHFKNLNVLHFGHQTRDVRPTYAQFRAIIEDSPSLRELTLKGSAPLLPKEVVNMKLSIPFLESLHLSEVPPDYASGLMSLFHSPNLKSLILSELDIDDYSNLFNVIAGPPALFPNLTSLKLKAVDASNAAGARLLHAYPKLESLELYDPEWVALLGPSGGDGTLTEPSKFLCPALKYLRCVTTDSRLIKDMLNKRKEANVPLPKLEIDIGTYHYPYVVGWLESNTELKIIDPSDCDSDDLTDGSYEDYSDELDDSGFSNELPSGEEEEGYDDDGEIDDEEEGSAGSEGSG